MTQLITDKPSLASLLMLWRQQGESSALVPTMGSIHEGHLALIQTARTLADHVIVTIFVNPTQFAEGEDFDSYPRALDADLAAIRDADIIFYDDNVPATLLEVARREVDLIAFPKKFASSQTPAGLAAALLRAATGGKSVVYLGSQNAAEINTALLTLGFVTPSLITGDEGWQRVDHLQTRQPLEAHVPERVQ